MSTLVLDDEPAVQLVLEQPPEILLMLEEQQVVLECDADPAVALQIVEQEALVLELGAQGPPGRDGVNGAGALPYPFAWGHATPVSLGVHAGVVVAISIVIVDAFDAADAELAVGALGQPPLLAADQNVPVERGRYESNPGVRLSTPTELYLFLNPGLGASAGSGIVYLEITA